MDLSIIIVSRNTSTILAQCLRTVPGGVEGLEYETLVVDNGSTDGTAERVRREFPAVKLLCNAHNVGFGAANNQGIRASTGAFTLFLNSDTLIPRKALSDLVAWMQAHPDSGACGPRLLQRDGRVQPYAFGGDPTPGYLFRRGATRWLLRHPLHDWETSQVQAVDWVSGACLLARRTALDPLGGFDEHFFMYFEDNDLCLRFRRAGWKVYYEPQVAITHLGGASAVQAPERTRWYDASLRYFYRKHYTLSARLVLEFLLPFYRRMDH